MGPAIIAIRNKFLVYNTSIELLDTERGFLLFALQDTYATSHSAIVKSQLGMSLQLLRPDFKPRTVSSISDSGMGPGGATTDALSGTYQTEWHLMQSCLHKLGQAPPPPYKPLVNGPDGDPGGISTPMHHDPRDGTGYNDT